MAISNSVIVSNIAVPFGLKLTEKLVVCLNTNHTFDPTFKGGNGTTMNISVPDVGNVSTGPAFSQDADLSYTGAKVPLTLTQNKIGIALTAQNLTTDFSNIDKQAKVPYTNNLSSVIQKNVIGSLQYGALSGEVATAGSEFNSLANGAMSIRQARGTSDLAGCLSPIAQAKIIASGIKFYNPQPEISELFRSGYLGDFADAPWFQTPDFTNFTWTDGMTASGGNSTLRGALTFTSGTTNQVVITVSTGTLTGTIAKGTMFQLTGLNKTDYLGNDTGIPITFTVQAAATASTNTVTATVQQIYATGSTVNGQPLQNINTSSNVSATALTYLFTSGKNYAWGSVWEKDALAFGEVELEDIYGAENEAIRDPQGIMIKASVGPDIRNGYGILRMDVLTGSTMIYAARAHNIFFQLN